MKYCERRPITDENGNRLNIIIPKKNNLRDKFCFEKFKYVKMKKILSNNLLIENNSLPESMI